MITLIDELVRLKGRLQTVFASATAAVGLSPIESTVLAAVVESKSPPTVSQIGRSLGHPRQVIQRAANALIKAKLLATVENPDHKRARLLKATLAGETLYKDVATQGKQAAGSLARILDVAECERLAHELHELRRKIEAHLRTKKDGRLRRQGGREDAARPLRGRKAFGRQE